MTIINASTNTVWVYPEWSASPIAIPPNSQVQAGFTNALQTLEAYYPATGNAHTLDDVGPNDVVSYTDAWASLVPVPLPGSHYPQVWWDGVIDGLPLSAALLVFLAIRRAFRVGDSCHD